jgi:hypothetical protein
MSKENIPRFSTQPNEPYTDPTNSPGLEDRTDPNEVVTTETGEQITREEEARRQEEERRRSRGLYDRSEEAVVSTFRERIRRGGSRELDITNVAVDTLQLSNNTINATGFGTSSLNGFSSQRPEIIALTDYEPIFNPSEELTFTNSGYFVDYKYQTNQLRKNTVQSLVLSLSRNPTTRNNLNTLTTNLNSFISREETKLDLFKSAINVFDLFDKAFQVRELDDGYFRINNILNTKDFFIRKMGFNETSYNTFSDTKILYQLLRDLRSASEDYSFNLLNLTDPDRTNDLNSVNLDVTYTKSNGFSFTIQGIKSPGSSTNIKSALNNTDFMSFTYSLPAAPVDRIKLLMQVTNRVLRVSRGLSKQSVRTNISTNFSVNNDDNPFDNILGATPRDIFSTPFGINTIGTNFYLTDTSLPGVVILPFESTIVDDGETTYVPGNLFFKNTAIQNGSVNNLVSFSENFSSKISNTYQIYNDIFEFFNFNNNLLPIKFSLKFLTAIKNSLNYVSTGGTNGTPTQESLFLIALINYSQIDRTLKYLLFQFFILLGLSSVASFGENSIFKNLKREIIATDAFFDIIPNANDLDLNRNTAANIRRKALQTAQDITTYISERIAGIASLRQNTDLVSSTNERLIIDNIAQMPTLLVNSALAVFDSQPNLFKDFINIAASLDDDASVIGNANSYLNANLFTTRYENISLSYVLLMQFEILCSFTKLFFNVNFDTDNKSNVTVIFNKNDCLLNAKGIERTITSLPTAFSTETGGVNLGSTNTDNSGVIFNREGDSLTFNTSQIAKINQTYDTTRQIANALVEEENFLKNILGIFNVISLNLTEAKRLAIDTFSRFTDAEKTTLRTSSNILKKSQYRVASNLLNQLKRTNSIVDPYTFSITEDEYNHLLSLNKTFRSLSNERTKILTIGLPNGFIDSLKGKSSKTAAISGAEQITDLTTQQGIISLCVYRKSLLYEQIIFKPKKLIFDLSLFSDTYQDDLTIDPFGQFNLQNGLITLKDKSNIRQENNLVLSNINTYTRYTRYLTNQQKQEMFSNHIKDYLFGKYVTLLTGLKLTNEVFPMNRYSGFISNSDQVNQLLRSYLQTLGVTDTRPIPEIVADRTINRSIRDNISLMQISLSSLRTEIIDQIIFSEKMFDRIFNVQINIDTDFEVDTKRTPEVVLRNESIASKLFKLGDKTYIRDLEGAIMDDFYVSVEGIA